MASARRIASFVMQRGNATPFEIRQRFPSLTPEQADSIYMGQSAYFGPGGRGFDAYVAFIKRIAGNRHRMPSPRRR